MAGVAGNRAARFVGPFLFFMAFDALQIHDLFRFDRPFGFHRFDGVFFLRKNAMTNIAILKSLLVLGMGKGNLAFLATENIDFGSPFVGGYSDGRYDGHGQDDYAQDKNLMHHASLLMFCVDRNIAALAVDFPNRPMRR
jgi:hypothetical protein